MKTVNTFMALLVAVLSLLHIDPSQAVELNHVRIGEYKAYTRLVFEFGDSVRFNQQSATESKIVSIAFPNTTTSLPRNIECATTARIETINFIQEHAQLVAQITLSSPALRIKSFSLDAPARIVVDAYELSTRSVQNHTTKTLASDNSIQAQTPTAAPLHNDIQPPTPNTAVTLHNEAIALQKQGQFQSARRLYQAALNQTPNLASALNNVGVIYIKERNFSSARVFLQKAIQAKPDYAEAYYNMACLYALQKNVKPSLSYLKSAITFEEEARHWAMTDKDLRNVRSNPDFDRIIRPKPKT
jgi:tetratricopeptide (TPR) repeat protein